jgi:HlyD family secretion protein/epimerase transport system membrane fusion protein
MALTNNELTLRSGVLASRVLDDGPGRFLFFGALSALGLLVALFVWASTLQVASAALASGEVTVEGNRKAVQHRDGGPVEAVFVREGQRVAKGEPLLKLNMSESQAEEAVLRTQLMQALARVARLRAETSGSGIAFPEELESPDGQAVARQAEELFRARRDAYLGQVGILTSQVEGAKQQIDALGGRLSAIEAQLQTVQEEADSIAALVKEGLITKTRKLALDRAAAEFDGDEQMINASIAEQKSIIEQSELKKTQLQKDRSEAIAKDLADAEALVADARPRLVAVRKRLDRGVLVAPEEGFVFGLAAFGPGAVITPGQTVLEIVPADDALVLSVEISPADIDEVEPQQHVTVHLLSYRQRYQIKLTGVLEKISPDEIEDKVRQVKFYRGIVKLDPSDLSREGAELVPGMPVQVMIETGARTIASYILDPLLRTYEYAFRDN